MNKAGYNLLYAALFAALIGVVVWLVIGRDSTSDANDKPDFARCVSDILQREMTVQKKDAVKFGTILGDVMKPDGASSPVEVSSERSRDLKTVLDKVPPDSLKAVLEGCRDAQHTQQTRGFFRGKATAIVDATGKWLDGVVIRAVSDASQQCTTSQGTCPLPLQAELLAREILVSVQKPGYTLLHGQHNSTKVSPQELTTDGVEFHLQRWPRFAVQVTRAQAPVEGATVQILSATPTGDVWPLGCVERPGMDEPKSCAPVQTSAAGVAEFEAPQLPASVAIVVNGAPAEQVSLVEGQAHVQLASSNGAHSRDTAACKEDVLRIVRNELITQKAPPAHYAFQVAKDGSITGTNVPGVRGIKPDERQLPCRGALKLP